MKRIDVRPISVADHLAFVAGLPAASFLQTPAWGTAKAEWRHESLGWFRGDALVGAGLALYRELPVLRRSLAYLPEGPLLDWAAPDLRAQLTALGDHVKRRGAFAVRIGPPVPVRFWSADTVKRAVAEDGYRRLGDVPADRHDRVGSDVQEMLRVSGWRPLVAAEGFAAGQPAYVFQLPLTGRDENDLLAGMNQLWRRNIKKADKAGVKVERGAASDLPDFHRLYLETATRDGFTPRPLDYFHRMFEALLAEDPDRIRLYLARHDQDLVAAAIRVRVGGHVWYSYGASSAGRREVRGSNAVQWQMIRDAVDEGADVYDLRGITDTLDPRDPHVGLIQFKAGTGGEAVQTVGEWDFVLNRPLYKSFGLYMSRR